jgi:hypothetical protein
MKATTVKLPRELNLLMADFTFKEFRTDQMINFLMQQIKDEK